MRTATSTLGLLAMAIGVAALFLIGLPAPVASQAEKYRVGVVTLLAGPFAASIGVPAKNGAEMVAEAINNGTLPAPYATKGVAGRSLELVVVDESTGTAKQVTEFRGLAGRREVAAHVGYLVDGGGQYGAEISALLTKKPTVVHTAFAGGDFEAFVVQMTARGLHQNIQMVMTAGAGSMYRLLDKLPDGVFIEDRGPYSVFARPTALGNWFRTTYEQRYGITPPYTAYHVGQAVLAFKIAADKASKGGAKPAPEEIGRALEQLKFDAFGTTVHMSRSRA